MRKVEQIQDSLMTMKDSNLELVKSKLIELGNSSEWKNIYSLTYQSNQSVNVRYSDKVDEICKDILFFLERAKQTTIRKELVVALKELKRRFTYLLSISGRGLTDTGILESVSAVQ